MNVKMIHIELELSQEEKELGHATIIEFKDGMWTADGAMFPRVSGALNEIYQLLRGRKS